MVSEIDLSVEKTGERLDRWLVQKSPELSRARVQKLIEAGRVQLNGEVCVSKKTLLQSGDRIHIEIPNPQPLELEPEAIPLEILYEDDSMLVINKPTGLVVHPSPGHEAGTLVHALLAHCPTLAGIGGVQRPGIVHRLDKDTTGAIVIAKTDQAHANLQAQIQAKTACREYLGVVCGAPKAPNGRIDLPIGRHPIDRKKMAVVPVEKGGRPAVTHWWLQERLGNYSLLHFRLETGRTHQIRVHCHASGHPIVGDPVYGAGIKVGVNLPGQALHAWRLQLQHPLTGDLISVTAAPPPAFLRLLEVLRRRVRSVSSNI